MSLAVTMSRVASIVAFALVVDQRAHAERPWHQRMTEAAQNRARTAYDEGLDLLQTYRYSQAVRAFRRSLKDWDHPTTHFLLATVLLKLDERQEALLEFWEAMRYGGQPLPLEHLDEIKYQTGFLLHLDLGVLVVNQATGPVVVNGRTVSNTTPWYGVVLPGEHWVGPHKVMVMANHRIDIDDAVKSTPLDSATISELQLALLGFEVRYPTPYERENWAWKPKPLPESVVTSPPAELARTNLPPPVDKICVGATGELEIVCRHYQTERDHLVHWKRHAEHIASIAIQRINELTMGYSPPELR